MVCGWGWSPFPPLPLPLLLPRGIPLDLTSALGLHIPVSAGLLLFAGLPRGSDKKLP